MVDNLTRFNDTQFSDISTEYADFNKDFVSYIQIWDDYLFEITGLRINNEYCHQIL